MDSGFFYVINHGISEEFMDQVFSESKKFFDLPLEEKMKLLRNEKHRGYTPVLDELLDPVNQLQGLFKFDVEFLIICPILPILITYYSQLLRLINMF